MNKSNPNIKAHLLRGAFYLLVLLAVCVIPFALGQRTPTKQSAVAVPLEVSTLGEPLFNSDNPTNGTWSATGSLNAAREVHTATLLPNGKVLVAGGVATRFSLSSAELYDPASGTWIHTDNLGTARRFHTATLLPNGKVLVAGGQDNSFFASAGAELYDPASGSWSSPGSLNTARLFHTATLLRNGKVLVTGGEGNSGILSSARNSILLR